MTSTTLTSVTPVGRWDVKVDGTRVGAGRRGTGLQVLRFMTKLLAWKARGASKWRTRSVRSRWDVTYIGTVTNDDMLTVTVTISNGREMLSYMSGAIAVAVYLAYEGDLNQFSRDMLENIARDIAQDLTVPIRKVRKALLRHFRQSLLSIRPKH